MSHVRNYSIGSVSVSLSPSSAPSLPAPRFVKSRLHGLAWRFGSARNAAAWMYHGFVGGRSGVSNWMVDGASYIHGATEARDHAESNGGGLSTCRPGPSSSEVA